MTLPQLPTVSASKIKTYRTCHKQFYYKYVLPKGDRPAEDKNIGALMGLSLHKAIEKKYRAGDNPTQVFQQTMLETLDDWEEEGFKINGIEWFSKSLKDGKDILREFDWNRFHPIELEMEFLLPFPNAKAPIALVNGYIDMVSKDDMGYDVIDHKSQRKIPTQDQLNHDSQFILYAWAARELYGNLPRATIWNDLRNNRLIVVDVITDFDFKLGQLVYDIDALIHEDKYPRRQMDNVCLKECSFYQNCYGLTVKQVAQAEFDDSEE